MLTEVNLGGLRPTRKIANMLNVSLGEKSRLFETIIATDRMIVGHLVAGAYENNVYLISCAATGKAVVIDAAADASRIIAGSAGLDVQSILTTHGHFDHIGAVDEVKTASTSRFGCTRSTAASPGGPPMTPSRTSPLWLATSRFPPRTPRDIHQARCASWSKGFLFTGDTLFPGGPGATRFEYSDFDLIIDSIETRLMTLPDATQFFPGHGDTSTIGTERPSLPEWIERRW